MSLLPYHKGNKTNFINLLFTLTQELGKGNRHSRVHTKTFSTHDEPKICHVVRKSGVFTHGKNSHDGVGCIKTSLRLLTSPARVEPLEVRFAHPVRLAPDTHSQGHGRPCLQRLHPRRAFPATWIIFCDSLWIFIWYRLKRFPRTKHIFKASLCRSKRFLGTKSETDTSTSPFSGFRVRETGGKEKNRVRVKPPQARAY